MTDHRRCAMAITRRLAEHGGWLGRPELQAGLGYGVEVVDDELADLVAAGDVLYNARAREYRLGGTPWARRALRDLLRSNLRRAAVVGQSQDKRHAMVGLAERTPQADGTEQLVMSELELPYDGLPGMLRLTAAMQEWVR